MAACWRDPWSWAGMDLFDGHSVDTLAGNETRGQIREKDSLGFPPDTVVDDRRGVASDDGHELGMWVACTARVRSAQAEEIVHTDQEDRQAMDEPWWASVPSFRITPLICQKSTDPRLFAAWLRSGGDPICAGHRAQKRDRPNDAAWPVSHGSVCGQDTYVVRRGRVELPFNRVWEGLC